MYYINFDKYFIKKSKKKFKNFFIIKILNKKYW